MFLHNFRAFFTNFSICAHMRAVRRGHWEVSGKSLEVALKCIMPDLYVVIRVIAEFNANYFTAQNTIVRSCKSIVSPDCPLLFCGKFIAGDYFCARTLIFINF